MARLTDEEYRAWCQRNDIAPRTEAYIQRLRQSEPELRVRTSAEYDPFYIQNLKFLQDFWTHLFSIGGESK